MLKWIDMPPVWLAGALVVAWNVAIWRPFGLSLEGAITDLLGGVMVGGGLVLLALAIYEMRRRKTTIIPHQQADHLVTSGIFKRSRNPIYLGDALILTGLILRWDAPLALPLVPIFVWIIEKRFILPEEDGLRRTFRIAFHKYTQQTRRWI